MVTEPCCPHPLSPPDERTACCLCGRVFAQEKPTMLYVDAIELEALRRQVGEAHLRRWKELAL